MTDVAACVGLGQLRRLEQFNARRRALAMRYFKQLRTEPGMLLPARDDEGHSWHMFAPLLPLDELTISRAEFIAQMAARFAAGRHIGISRRGLEKGPVDDALGALGLERQVVTIVGGFSTALALARASDLVASVPEKHTASLRAGMFSFSLPMPVPAITVSLLWHPRLDADPAHRWLRGCVRDICTRQAQA